MVDWLMHHGWWVGVGSVGLSSGGLVLGLAVMIRLPADYFLHERRRPVLERWRHPVLRILILMSKNVFGALAFCAGAVMALPLVPGPGLLFMILGISLLDFPGKYAVERYLMGKARVLASVNRVRARWGRGPLVVRGDRATRP